MANRSGRGRSIKIEEEEILAKVLRLSHTNGFRHFFRHVRMSRVQTPATQNDIRTCFEPFENQRFCSFPHRHGDVTRRPENRDGASWSLKKSVSCETSSKSAFSQELSHEPESLPQSQNRCEASVNFHHMSQNAKPATESARCHHLRQPAQCDLQKARNTTPLTHCMLEVSKARASQENGSHVVKTMQKYCACHT